ncbi:MAG: hypothetical protein JSV36_19720 [Anaerolineae bacterium]|nr:MAG: hypothetical protein JSV36_19720 [Anaerolineae bacterium]
MKRYALLLALLLPPLATSCIGESKEVSRAKADYIEAKTRQITAEARIEEARADALELQNERTEALQAQQLEQERQNWQAAEARRDTWEKVVVQTVRVLAYIVATTAAVFTLSWAASDAYQVWVKNRLKLQEAMAKEARARAEALREERRAQEARATAFNARCSLTLAEAYRLQKERLLVESRPGANGRALLPATSLNKSQLPI